MAHDTQQRTFLFWVAVIIALVTVAVLFMLAQKTAYAGGGTSGLKYPCTEDDGQATIAYGGSMNKYTQWDSSHDVNYIEYSGELLTFIAPENGSTWEEYSDGNHIFLPGQTVTSAHFYVDCYLSTAIYPYYPGHSRPNTINVAEWLLQASNDVSMGNPDVQELAGQLRLRNSRAKVWIYNGDPRMFNVPWGAEVIAQSKTYRAGELTPSLSQAAIRFTEVDYTP